MIWSKRTGLQKRSFIYVGAGLTTVMILLAILSLQTVNQATDMVHQKQLTLVQNIALDFDDVIEHLRAEMVNAALVLEQGGQDELTDAHKEQLAFTRYHLGQHLVSFQPIEQAVFIAVLDDKGKVLWTEPYLAQQVNQSLADTATIRKAIEKGEVYIETEEALLTRDSPALSLVAPVKDTQGIVKRILIANIPILPGNNGFSAFLQRRGTDYNLELVTENGLILAGSLPQQDIKESPHWATIRPLAQERLSGIEKHRHPESGEEHHLVTFAPLAEVPWGVILTETEGKALELPWIMGKRLLIVSGLVVLVAAGLSWGFTQQIVRPLRHLAATAQNFGSGNLDAPIPTMGRDEIGQLAESLDAMRHQLKHSLDEIKQWNQELEQRVKQRTNELEELSQQLRQRDRERGELLGKIITAQEEERRRIARELHDEVSQSLTSLMIGFKVLEGQDPDKMEQGMTELKQLTAQTLDGVHNLAVELRPSSLDDLGLITTLQQYTREYSDKFGIKADFQATGLETKRLPPQVEITLYRIIQEALTNVAKHAEAKKVSVLMGIRDSSVVAIIEDDGKGFDVQKVLTSRISERKLGLYGMQERAALIDGVLTIESTPTTGTAIFVEVPLKGEELNDQDTGANRR